MRALVFFLILANLLFWAWVQGYLGVSSNPDALRVKQQLLADRVRIVSSDEPPHGGAALADASKAAVKSEAASDSAPDSVPEKVPEKVPDTSPGQASERAPETKTVEVCLLLGDTPVEDAVRLEKSLAERLPDFKAKRTATREAVTSYWVYIPPLANKKEVDTKVAELKKLQVPEYFVIQEDGPNNHAISLGLFSTRDAADNYLETLRGKKVRSARVTEKTVKPAATTVEISGPESSLDALRQSISDVLPESRPAVCGVAANAKP